MRILPNHSPRVDHANVAPAPCSLLARRLHERLLDEIEHVESDPEQEDEEEDDRDAEDWLVTQSARASEDLVRRGAHAKRQGGFSELFRTSKTGQATSRLLLHIRAGNRRARAVDDDRTGAE